MSPFVSVIIPVYKVEQYLKRCVESLLNQTYKNMEVILVDDGSPDNCPRMCDCFASEHDGIIALHKENGGLGDARNYGVRFANSEWIVFVDSDDYVEAEYVEALINIRDKFDAEMVITRTIRENEAGSGKPMHKKFDSYLADKKTALYEVYGGMDVGWSACGKLFLRSILLKHPFPNGFYEDCACMYKIINEFERIAIGDYESNYHYIQREGSILRASLDERHLYIFEIVKEFEAFIYEEHPDLGILIVYMYQRAVVQLLNLQNMPWQTYKSIFLKYRESFRSNFKDVMKDTRITWKNKAYYLLLCGRPEIFWLQKRILNSIR